MLYGAAGAVVFDSRSLLLSQISRGKAVLRWRDSAGAPSRRASQRLIEEISCGNRPS